MGGASSVDKPGVLPPDSGIEDTGICDALDLAAAHAIAEPTEGDIPVDDHSKDMKTLLVFGSAGTGKTSFVNALTGQSLPTNGGAKGVTLSSQVVLAHHDGVDYRIIDTAGLDEAKGGSVTSVDAVWGIIRLLKRSQQGLNLMVMVVPKGRILTSTLDNYEFFVNQMVAKKVPVLIVVTHCEREAGDMQGWVDTNEEDFISRGIQSSRMVATTFMTPDPAFDNVELMQAKVNGSFALSWDAIQSCATPMPVEVAKGTDALLSVFKRMYNSVARRFGHKIWVSDAVVTMVQRMTAMDRAQARTLLQKAECSGGSDRAPL